MQKTAAVLDRAGALTVNRPRSTSSARIKRAICFWLSRTAAYLCAFYEKVEKDELSWSDICPIVIAGAVLTEILYQTGIL